MAGCCLRTQQRSSARLLPTIAPCFPETPGPTARDVPSISLCNCGAWGEEAAFSLPPPEDLVGMPGAGRPARGGQPATTVQRCWVAEGKALGWPRPAARGSVTPSMLSLSARAWTDVSIKLEKDQANKNVLPQHTAASHSSSRDIPGPTWMAQNSEEGPYIPSMCSSGCSPLSAEPQLLPTMSHRHKAQWSWRDEDVSLSMPAVRAVGSHLQTVPIAVWISLRRGCSGHTREQACLSHTALAKPRVSDSSSHQP